MRTRVLSVSPREDLRLPFYREQLAVLMGRRAEPAFFRTQKAADCLEIVAMKTPSTAFRDRHKKRAS